MNTMRTATSANFERGSRQVAVDLPAGRADRWALGAGRDPVRTAGESQPDRKLTIELLRGYLREVLARGAGKRHAHLLMPDHDPKASADQDALFPRNRKLRHMLRQPLHRDSSPYLGNDPTHAPCPDAHPFTQPELQVEFPSREEQKDEQCNQHANCRVSSSYAKKYRRKSRLPD